MFFDSFRNANSKATNDIDIPNIDQSADSDILVDLESAVEALEAAEKAATEHCMARRGIRIR